MEWYFLCHLRYNVPQPLPATFLNLLTHLSRKIPVNTKSTLKMCVDCKAWVSHPEEGYEKFLIALTSAGPSVIVKYFAVNWNTFKGTLSLPVLLC